MCADSADKLRKDDWQSQITGGIQILTDEVHISPHWTILGGQNMSLAHCCCCHSHSAVVVGKCRHLAVHHIKEATWLWYM